MNPWLAGILGVLIGCAMGLNNAVLVQFIAIPAIVATLATLSIYRGLSQALSKGEQVTGLPADNSFFTFLGGDALGLPVSVWILILVTTVLTLVLRFTPYGYRVRAIGSNPEAATFSGISIPRVRVQTLVLIGALCGLSGMLGLAFFSPVTRTSAPASSCRRSPPPSSAARRSGAAQPPSSARCWERSCSPPSTAGSPTSTSPSTGARSRPAR
jgi:ribose/xylose/arabinose/galactoside ABC-type transport system permease subunit